MQNRSVSRAIPAATGIALMAAGLYQLTPLKRACLLHCRSPLSFFASHWHEGWGGALRLGLHHGLYCVGCCWGLMTIQLSLGVMSLPLMFAVAFVILVEKVWRFGMVVAAASGAAAIAAGGYVLVTSLL